MYQAQLLAVYITEAHASDEWPCGSIISFCRQPQTLSERCSLALKLVERNGKMELNRIQILVDSLTNDFQTTFAAWPFRFFVFFNGKISFIANPDAHTYLYDIEQVLPCLASLH